MLSRKLRKEKEEHRTISTRHITSPSPQKKKSAKQAVFLPQISGHRFRSGAIKALCILGILALEVNLIPQRFRGVLLCLTTFVLDVAVLCNVYLHNALRVIESLEVASDTAYI